jgi:hypothetical protein
MHALPGMLRWLYGNRLHVLWMAAFYLAMTVFFIRVMSSEPTQPQQLPQGAILMQPFQHLSEASP